MSTIAYKDGIMAADTMSHWFYSEYQSKKLFEMAGKLIGVAGGEGDAEPFANWITGLSDNKPELNDKDGFAALVVGNGVCVQYDETLKPLCSEPYAAIGSGAQYAIAAMDCGKSAHEAVQIAMHRDPYTGGKIETIGKLNTAR